MENSLSKLAFVSRENGLRTKWKAASREIPTSATVPSPCLDNLTFRFRKANQSKQFISTRNFLESLSNVLDNRVLSPFSSPLPRADLLNILIQELSLEVHGLSDSLHVSPLFEEWSAVCPVDVAFGAKIWANSDMHQGSNVFLFHGPDDKINTIGLLEV